MIVWNDVNDKLPILVTVGDKDIKLISDRIKVLAYSRSPYIVSFMPKFDELENVFVDGDYYYPQKLDFKGRGGEYAGKITHWAYINHPTKQQLKKGETR